MQFSYLKAIAALSACAAAAPTSSSELVSPRLINLDINLGSKGHKTRSAGPFQFTSTYDIIATPEQVVNAQNQFTGGLPGAVGYFHFGLNSNEDIICYNITLVNFRGEYESPAKTATHIHQGDVGKTGPPRIAFPNPVEMGDGTRRSIGCLTGPFETGLMPNGTDTGLGFTVKMIEENPTAFNADTHSSEAVPGAVRGQFGRAKKC